MDKTIEKLEGEQKYYSLNGAFGMLAFIHKRCDEGVTIDQLKQELLAGMKALNEEMSSIEIGLH